VTFAMEKGLRLLGESIDGFAAISVVIVDCVREVCKWVFEREEVSLEFLTGVVEIDSVPLMYR